MAASEFVSARYALARVVLVVLALVACYLMAPHLPVWTGWENGPVENLQALVLLAGGMLALWWRDRAGDRQASLFWLMVAPIWFVLCARELSWGAAFMTPLDFSPVYGPTFSSSQQLPYKPLIAPVIGLLLLGTAAVFVRSRQDQTLARLWRQGSFPLLEIALFVLAMLVSAEAEGHGIVGGFPSMGHAQQQSLEEMAELVGYAVLLLAQWRVARGLRLMSSPST
ncbi:MAG: hypothetical protein GAK30_00908 [Paracidovorax wautersii]|uniref:Uncharacterized protein n=1 Tax=Paracidovorax wautersii TaxID=1177982 RepID=A0A7V8JR63_9BURK|nr:MAG: hypothetical protein GAK30_00908 [Paracidovorax wautersii]